MLAELLQENDESFCLFLRRSEPCSPGYDVCLVMLRIQMTFGYLKRILRSCMCWTSPCSLKNTILLLFLIFYSVLIHWRLERNIACLKELWLPQSFWIYTVRHQATQPHSIKQHKCTGEKSRDAINQIKIFLKYLFTLWNQVSASTPINVKVLPVQISVTFVIANNMIT